MMKEIQRWAIPAAAVVAAGTIFVVYGGNSGNASSTSGKTQPSASPSDYADPTESPAAGNTTKKLEVASDGKLGKIVVDDQGRTLYRFDADSAKPTSVSNCNNACATAWPPVTADDKSVSVKGIDSKLLGTLARPDGTVQLTLAGWPLYRYAKDDNPGDTNGQGVSGKWFVTAPTGKKAAKPPAPAPAAPAAPKGNVLLRVVTDPELGKIVVDGSGRTLYRFDKDIPRPGGKAISNCLGACAKAWPPVLWTKGFKVVGVDRALLTNIMRKDGKCQIALNGWPLYRFAKDTAPGDTKGQGVGGIWFVSNPAGKKALASSGSGPGGYDGGSGY
ncbi:hypothetical protein ACRYCC_41265 [Actinomadura scrupuli]|uniref:hypothetical protein n=1 Tax=Actinomadura scrupuli TaxID=559629 RepID=UPI003D962067